MKKSRNFCSGTTKGITQKCAQSVTRPEKREEGGFLFTCNPARKAQSFNLNPSCHMLHNRWRLAQKAMNISELKKQ